MITSRQFDIAYVSRYKILEDDFVITLKYISLENENSKTYSVNVKKSVILTKKDWSLISNLF